MLTIEVRLLRDDGRVLRDPMLLSVQHYRLLEGLLKAGSGGFDVGSQSCIDFLNLLEAEAHDGSGGASTVLNVMGNRSTHGEYAQSIFLAVKGSAPVPADAPLVLVVVPSNKRVDEFETEWINTQKSRVGEMPEFVSKFPSSVTDVVVMTTAHFLGKRISEAGDGEKTTKSVKQPELAGFDSIFIDEFFQSSVWDIIGMTRRLMKLRAEQTPTDKEEQLRLYDIQLGSIRAREKRDADDADVAELRAELATLRAEVFPKRTKVFANGDTFQLTNVESWNYFGDKQEFCDTFLWRVFPKRIRLRENFRLTDPAERPVLMNILAQLKAGPRYDKETGEALESTRGFILRVLTDNGLGDQIFTDPDFVLRGGKPMPCIAWTNIMGNAINRRYGGEDKVGMKVVCRAYMMKKVTDKETGVVKKVGLRMNKVYKVVGMPVVPMKVGKSTKHVPCYAIEEDGETKFYPLSRFRRDIAQTGHAVQGETIAQDFAIFEFGSNPD